VAVGGRRLFGEERRDDDNDAIETAARAGMGVGDLRRRQKQWQQQ
jgi:hypothetical protein